MKNDKIIDIKDKIEIAINSIDDMMSEILSVDKYYTFEENNIDRDIYGRYIIFSNKNRNDVVDIKTKLKELKRDYSEFYNYLLKEQYDRMRKTL